MQGHRARESLTRGHEDRSTSVAETEGGDDRSPTNIQNEYVLIKDFSGEHERLELLEQMADGFSVAAIRAAGFSTGWKCLEVGSGSGSIARWLARESGDPSLVTATDLDARWLGPLERDGFRVLRHNVVTDDFPSGSFDLIHARCLLEHIVAREEVVVRIADWLTPDGVAVLVDCASFPVVGSPNNVYRAAMRAWVEAIGKTGTDYAWTRTLPTLLQRHGYRDVGASVMCPILRGGTPTSRFWSLTLETLRDRIIEFGLLTSEAFDDAQRLLADPDF